MVQRRGGRRCRFQPGHTACNKGVSRPASKYTTVEEKSVYVRLHRDIQELADSTDYASTSHSMPPLEDHQPTARILRPRTARATALEDAQQPVTDHAEMDTYRLFHANKTADLFHEAMLGHRAAQPGCVGKLTFYQPGEIQRGLCWREQLACDLCDYISPRRKLYKDVENRNRGPKTASANHGAQVGMAHTGVSNTGLCKILLATDTPAPAKSSMQAAANRVNKILENTNEEHMNQICRDLQQIQAARGQKTDINIEMDARYNNPVYAGVGVTPFQPATQVTQLVAENVTSKKMIIQVTNKSKLCQVCALNRSQDSGKPHQCTANLKLDDSIGDERRWAQESLSALQDKGIGVNIITTDPDGSAFKAAEGMFLDGQ